MARDQMGRENQTGASNRRLRFSVLLAAALASFTALAVLFVALNTMSLSDAQAEKAEPKAASKKAPAKNFTPTLDHDAGEVVEPEGYRLTDFRAPVPATLKGAQVVEAEEAKPLLQAGDAVFIDVYPRAPKPPNLPKNTVWREPAHMSIKGSVWLPNVGYGVLAPHVETYFKTHLERLTGGDTSKKLVFFCLKDCWMSWNAAKRALEWGYKSIVWFPDGTDGWQEIGERLVQVTPEKSTGS